MGADKIFHIILASVILLNFMRANVFMAAWLSA